ncbi:MAG: hypothetical protein AAGB46_04965, partial [Verrucomicrobiota bacterium]
VPLRHARRDSAGEAGEAQAKLGQVPQSSGRGQHLGSPDCGPGVSPCRLASLMSIVLVLCLSTHCCSTRVFDNLRKHCFYEKRKKPNQRQILEKLLT